MNASLRLSHGLNVFRNHITSFKIFINLPMNFNELAAIFVKLSRRLDGNVNTPKFEFRHYESLSWDLNIYSHRRLSEF